MILMIPLAALRNANGSFEPLGTIPNPNIPVMESALSAIATSAPSFVRGTSPSTESGLYWS